jgi:hypothetical protein
VRNKAPHSVSTQRETTKILPLSVVVVVVVVIVVVLSWGRAISIVSDYGLGDRAIGVSSPAEAKGIFL